MRGANTTTTMDFPRRVRVRGQSIQPVPGVAWDRYEVRIPVLDPATRPIVLAAGGIMTHAVDKSPVVAWRRDEYGHHWRPAHVAVPDTSPSARSMWTLRDHPLAEAVQRALAGQGDETTRSPSILGGRRGAPDLDTAFVAALAAGVGRDELAEIDRVVHRRADLPVWALVRGDGAASSPVVRLVLPEHVGADDAMALFPVDRLEDAMDAMDALSLRNPDAPVRKSDPVVGDVRILGEIDWRPGAVAALVHAVDLIERGVADFTLGSLPRRVTSTYGALLDRTARMSRVPTHLDRQEFREAQWVLEDFRAAVDGLEGMTEVSWLAATLVSTLARSGSHDREGTAYGA